MSQIDNFMVQNEPWWLIYHSGQSLGSKLVLIPTKERSLLSMAHEDPK